MKKVVFHFDSVQTFHKALFALKCDFCHYGTINANHKTITFSSAINARLFSETLKFENIPYYTDHLSCVSWKSLKLSKTVIYKTSDFDGDNILLATVTEIYPDHIIINSNDMTLWIDDFNNDYVFVSDI